MREQAPPGIDFLSAKRIPLKTTARPRRAVYRVPLTEEPGARCPEPPSPLRRGGLGGEVGAGAGENLTPRAPLSEAERGEQASAAHAAIRDRIAAFLASTESWAERERPKPRAVNIRPYVDSLTVEDDALVISCWLTQEGSARADEIAAAVGITDPPLIERTELELMDEVPPDEAARTPKIEPQTRPLNRIVTGPRPEVPRETWGATANGPIVE
jgi:hypothetical protein